MKNRCFVDCVVDNITHENNIDFAFKNSIILFLDHVKDKFLYSLNEFLKVKCYDDGGERLR